MGQPYTVAEIAQVCHEANRALQVVQLARGSTGIPISPLWEAVDDETRRSAYAGVEAALAGATAEELHEVWCETKREQGWRHGQVKDPQLRTHPALVPYDELPAEQTVKDDLFASIVSALGDVADRPIDATGRHPSVASIVRYFEFGHLPPHLAAVSRLFAWLADGLLGVLDDGPELTVALRKLLEAKDCAVRAALDAVPADCGCNTPDGEHSRGDSAFCRHRPGATPDAGPTGPLPGEGN